MDKKQRLIIVSILSFLVIGGLVVFAKKNGKSENKNNSGFSIASAEAAISEGKLIEARKIYKDGLKDLESNPKSFIMVQKKIEELNMKILFSGEMDDNSVQYEVKSGDSLTKIAKQYDTTVDLIKQVNDLNSDILRIGQKLKVITAKFAIFVDKAQNILQLKIGDQVIKTYVVSTGSDGSTPAGSFKIVNKLVDPTWFRSGAVLSPGDEKNALGTRWLGLDIKGYGIHGTIEPDKMGQQVTLGCVRMLNEDVEELYSLVPTGTPVTIID